MIRCKNCGAQLGLLDEKCPYCGTPNQEAKKHVRELKKYQRDFHKTKDEVTFKVHSYSKSYGLLMTLVFLLLGFFVMCFLLGSSYEIASWIEKRDFYKHQDVIVEQLNDYIDAVKVEEYIEYYEQHFSSFYDEELYEYQRLYTLSYDYRMVKEGVLNYYTSTVAYKDPISDASNSLYSFLDYKDYVNHPYGFALYEDLKDFLKVFAGFEEKDFEGIETLDFSDLQKLVYRRIDHEE